MSTPYYPTTQELADLGFYEGYDALWLCNGTNDAIAAIDMDAYGTAGYILVNNRITHDADIESLADIKQLVESAKAPF